MEAPAFVQAPVKLVEPPLPIARLALLQALLSQLVSLAKMVFIYKMTCVLHVPSAVLSALQVQVAPFPSMGSHLWGVVQVAMPHSISTSKAIPAKSVQISSKAAPNAQLLLQ